MNEEINAIAYLDCADVFLQEEPLWDDVDERQPDPDLMDYN